VTVSFRSEVKNTDSIRVNIGIVFSGRDANDNEVYRNSIPMAIDPGATVLGFINVVDALSIQDWNKIITWKIIQIDRS
jgi:hypothetical protein